MELKSLITSEKTIEIDFPGCKGFKVKLSYLSREELNKIRKKCVVIGFNKRTRMPEEELDDELFTKLYIERAIKGWSGLKFKHLKDLIAIKDGATAKDDDEVEYNQDNANMLMQNSIAFDSWVTEVNSDVTNFNKDS